MWKNMDVAAFFSASGVEAFVSRMGKDKDRRMGAWPQKKHVAVAAIGEVTKKTAGVWNRCGCGSRAMRFRTFRQGA